MSREPTEKTKGEPEEKNIYKKNYKDLTVQEWVYRFQIPICIGFAMLGFALSVLTIACPIKRPTSWGELTIVNKVGLIDTLIDRRIKAINSAIIKLKATPPPTGVYILDLRFYRRYPCLQIFKWFIWIKKYPGLCFL